jgi:hypothetical protein
VDELISLRDPKFPSRAQMRSLGRIRRRRYLTIVPLLFFPCGVVLGRYLMLEVESWFLSYFVVLLIFLVPAVVTRCPRCGRSFHFSGGTFRTWNRSCLHCGFGEDL